MIDFEELQLPKGTQQLATRAEKSEIQLEKNTSLRMCEETKETLQRLKGRQQPGKHKLWAAN